MGNSLSALLLIATLFLINALLRSLGGALENQLDHWLCVALLAFCWGDDLIRILNQERRSLFLLLSLLSFFVLTALLENNRTGEAYRSPKATVKIPQRAIGEDWSKGSG
jgi:hypothetical protein